MKPTSTSLWEKQGNFKIDYGTPHSLNRQVTFKNKAQDPIIKKLDFLGYKDNTLRIKIEFKSESLQRDFARLYGEKLWSRDCTEFSSDESFYFDPKSQVEIDNILKLINECDPLDANTLEELPSILNTRINEHKAPSESYPPFDSNMRGGGSRFTIDNALSYALMADSLIPRLEDFDKQGSASAKLHYTVEEINKFYKQPDFALVATHEEGKLPIQRDGYYLIAMYHSSKGTVYINGAKYYQTDDYHFVRQNNDLLFSHRRGTGMLPELKDAGGQPIAIPEQANLFYILEGYSSYDEHFGRIPVCSDYKFDGYIYVLVAENRLRNYPHESYRMLDEIELKAQTSPQINELLTQFKNVSFLYPPQPEFFSDAREKIEALYQRMLAIEKVEMKEAGMSEAATTTTSTAYTASTSAGSNTFFSLRSSAEIDLSGEAINAPVKYV